MIDSPGFKNVAAQATAASCTDPVPIRAARSPAPGRPVADVSRTVETLAAEPPVDSDRVAVIRAAIANGSYPIT